MDAPWNRAARGCLRRSPAAASSNSDGSRGTRSGGELDVSAFSATSGKNRFLINFFPQNLFLCQTMGRSRCVSPTRGAGLPDSRAHVSMQVLHQLHTCAAPTLSCRTWGQAWSQLQSEAALPLQWALGKYLGFRSNFPFIFTRTLTEMLEQ